MTSSQTTPRCEFDIITADKLMITKGQYLSVVHVMYFVEDDEFDVSNKVRSFIEHASQDLCRHDETICLGIDLHIPSEDPHRGSRKCLLEVSIFLIRKRFDWRCVDGSEVSVR